MEKIASFTVNHDILPKGLFISRSDADIITYDLRMRLPNCGDYLSNSAIHTIEHLFATYVRNTAFSNEIIYVGPMGCRTGFYFLTRNTLTGEQVIKLLKETFTFIADYDDVIPGTAHKECGNCLEHDLFSAKKEAADYLKVIADYSMEMLNYPT